MTTGKSPAHIELQLGPPQERGGKFFINVVAENRGEQTAEGVYVEVVLKANGKEERGMFVIDRLPRQGKRGESSLSRRTLAWPLRWRHARSDTQSRSPSANLRILTRDFQRRNAVKSGTAALSLFEENS